MNHFLKLAYDAGAQRARYEHGLTKTALDPGTLVVGSGLIALPHISHAVDRRSGPYTRKDLFNAGNVFQRNIPNFRLDSHLAKINAAQALRNAESHGRVAGRTAARLGGGALGYLGGATLAAGAMLGPMGLTAPYLLPALGVGGALTGAEIAERTLVPYRDTPTRMQYLKHLARTPTGKAGLLAALLGGGALGYNTLKDDE